MNKEDMYVGMRVIDKMYPEAVGMLCSIDVDCYEVTFPDHTYEYVESDLRFLKEHK